MLRPKTRAAKTLALVGAGAVVIVIGLIIALVWHASTLEVRDGVRGQVDVVVLDAWATPWGHLVVGWDAEAEAEELVALADDGTILARTEMPPGRLAQVAMSGEAVFFDDDDERPASLAGATEIRAHWFEGGGLVHAWSRGFTVDGAEQPMAELSVVAHLPRNQTVIHGCAGSEHGCWLIGVDSSGEELWRLDADQLRPALAAERRDDQRPWLVPEELLVVQSEQALTDDENRPIVRVDPASGELEEVAHGARAVSGQGFAVISRFEDDGCSLTVVSDRVVVWRPAVPCGDEGQAPRHSVIGHIATFRAGDQMVVADVAQEAIATLPYSPQPVLTGVGTVHEHEPTRQLRRLADDTVLFEIGSGWFAPVVGDDAVVIRRTHRSRNPLAANPSTEVMVIDATDGSVCAHARFDGEPVREWEQAQPVLALSGCAALVEVDGVTHLLGR